MDTMEWLRAFVSAEFTATESRLTFERVLVYQDDQLVTVPA